MDTAFTRMGGPGRTRAEAFGHPGLHEHAAARYRRRGPWWEDWGPEWLGHSGGGPFRGGRRMRRGDIRAALLEALLQGPAHGYELINRLEDRTGGMWRPSPGSVYPTLQLLEDEGLVRSVEREGKRVYELSDAGRSEASARAEASGTWEEWARGGFQDGIRGLRRSAEKLGPLVRPFVVAMRQVAMNGESTKLDRAGEVLKRATKELYQILSED